MANPPVSPLGPQNASPQGLTHDSTASLLWEKLRFV
jgi:hypothetical protein